MSQTEPFPKDAFWKEEPFNFIKPDELEGLGIDPGDIPPGTFASHKHPSQILSRFGGNAYGFGFFEIVDRLTPREVELLQSINLDEPEYAKSCYKEINRIYKKIGLLIRFSSLGKSFYLIPINLVSGTISHIKSKADEISKIIHFHRKKYLKESHKIGLLTHGDDLIINDLSIRFTEHQFVVIESLERLQSMADTFDLVIMPRDIYEIVFMEQFGPWQSEIPEKKILKDYATYVLGKIYRLLKKDGELFIVADRHRMKTNQTVHVSFKTLQEEKNFLLFSHIFKTKKKYQMSDKALEINTFDFQKYLSGLYVEQEVLDILLEGRQLEEMKRSEIDKLPYLNFPLDDGFAYDQGTEWSKLLSVFFNELFLKPLLPGSIGRDWEARFSTPNYSPNYMLIYLGQKKPAETRVVELKKDVMESSLSGCPLPLLALYRDSFSYLIRTLKVLKSIKDGHLPGVSGVFMEQLKEPLVNKKRRYSGLNNILKLMSKINRLEKIGAHLNPHRVEGAKTKVLANLETLSLFGFSYGELEELILIVVGHTAMGRILSGKMNETALKPVSDLARTLEAQQAMNLLSYCRLMSMAETLASKKTDMSREQLTELFGLYESMVRVVTNRESDWDRLLDEKISSTGGIHNKIIRKILKMMNHFHFLDNWSELRGKGVMEKESLADYDDVKLSKIENVIRLVEIIGQFEDRYLKEDPLQLSILYRKFLNIEFHGTGHIFERMESSPLFLLLWVTVNLVRGDIINFNPILAEIDPREIDNQVKKVEEEARSINTDYLDLATLKQFSEQLYETRTSFIVGTGFQLKVNPKTQALDITYINMDENIENLERLARKFEGRKISEIPKGELEELETLFSNLEGFFQSHLKLISSEDSGIKLPERQKTWFRKAQKLREFLRSNFIRVIFQPENVYTDIDLLFCHSHSLLQFVLPEFIALEDIKLPGRLYIKSQILEHTFNSTRKIQSLIRKDRESFQDVQLLHKVAQREFGPMVAGIVGLNETQIEDLEKILEDIRRHPALFEALVRSFIFQDIGMMPAFREKYRDDINRADYAQAGAYFLEREKIPARYSSDERSNAYLVDLVKYHDFIHHMARGEFSLYASQELLDFEDPAFFDTFFVSSFIMFSAMREDLVLEDFAGRLFRIREVCHRILKGETTLERHLQGVYARRGHLFSALESYTGLEQPLKKPPANYLKSYEWRDSEREDYIRAGKMVYAMERLFRLRGIRYVEFQDLAKFIIKVPLKFIYQRRNYFGVGYPTFEKEMFEVLRMYNGLETLAEDMRRFILQHLITDEVRLYGFENVTVYMNYENMIKLLVIVLMGSQRFKKSQKAVCLNFMSLSKDIERRYEAVNDLLNRVSLEKIWANPNHVKRYFKAKTGLLLQKDESHRVLTIDFIDRINISQKVSYMGTITDVEQLKNYFYYSLRSLRKTAFNTEDYELALEGAFDNRLKEITDFMLDQAKKQMELLKDFKEIHGLVDDLMDRSLEIGFSDEQKHRLMDLYELRKDSLRREKLEEIENYLESINENHELKDYWDSIKWYLLDNRFYLGKEFENLVARKFDEAMKMLMDGE